MNFRLIILPTDALLFLLVIGIICFLIWTYKHEHLRTALRQVLRRRIGMVALVILLTYVVIGLLDSIHFQIVLPQDHKESQTYYSLNVKSLLDVLVAPLGQNDEQTYSAPFATHAYTKEIVQLPNGQQIRTYPRLLYAGNDLKNPQTDKARDIAHRIIIATAQAFAIWLIFCAIIIILLSRKNQQKIMTHCKNILCGKTYVAWREILLTIGVVLWIIFVAAHLVTEYHILGTDKVGKDVFYEAIKSIRTGLIIGTLTTLIMLPFAIFFGTAAGYYGGWIDDAVQYVYTTLSSIPAVLLIVAAILSLQVFIESHAAYFSTLAIRADIRLLALCAILGITSWTNLCRLLRAETLKLREMDFVAAAITLGTCNRKIIFRHILPNLMHIILITVVLDFSALVLAEAVLSYVGVGVDPTTLSWGNMINSARLELAREPVVWWPLLAAFLFMFTLVLSANLFADAVRDAYDPRLRNIE